LSNSSRLPANTDVMLVNPVMFPPGRAMLSTSPDATGSDPLKNTIGIVLVAFLATRVSFRGDREEHVNFETDRLLSDGGEPVGFVFCVSILQSYVLALNTAEFTELSQELLAPRV